MADREYDVDVRTGRARAVVWWEDHLGLGWSASLDVPSAWTASGWASSRAQAVDKATDALLRWADIEPDIELGHQAVDAARGLEWLAARWRKE